MPVKPGPEFITMTDWEIGILSNTIEPCVTPIKTYLDTLHLMAPSIVCKSLNPICLTRCGLGETYSFALLQLNNDGIEVLFVVGSIGMVEHRCREFSIFLSDEGRQHTIVPDVLMASVFHIRNPNFAKPFDTSSSDIA